MFRTETINVIAAFAYEMARVHDGNCVFTDYGDDVDEFHRILAHKTGVRPDNKESFVFGYGDTTLGVWFHDGSARFGTLTTYVRVGVNGSQRSEVLWSNELAKANMRKMREPISDA